MLILKAAAKAMEDSENDIRRRVASADFSGREGGPAVAIRTELHREYSTLS